MRVGPRHITLRGRTRVHTHEVSVNGVASQPNGVRLVILELRGVAKVTPRVLCVNAESKTSRFSQAAVVALLHSVDCEMVAVSEYAMRRVTLKILSEQSVICENTNFE